MSLVEGERMFIDYVMFEQIILAGVLAGQLKPDGDYREIVNDLIKDIKGEKLYGF